MNKVLEKATGHFRARIGGEMRKVHVPEWECDIYFKEANTLKEESKLIELAQQGKTVEALVETLIMKARNQDGTKMFTVPDKVILMNEVDPSVVIRVVGEMNLIANDAASLDDAEKN
jgi:hypothetical protein